MKKRIVCVLLTLIMLLSLVPMGASAATRSVSEPAITVLKQMTTLRSTCYLYNKTSGEFRTGYGTICDEKGHDTTVGGSLTSKHKSHNITEANADLALRKALTALDEKVNSFASANGLSLSQGQHDALVVFSYNAGTGWMNGNGVLKTVIVNGGTTNELLNAMNLWTKDSLGYESIDRRKVEANMYVNGIYSNVVPTTFGKITYNPNGGAMAQSNYGDKYIMYYDTNESIAHPSTPTKAGSTFLGWYLYEGSKIEWVPKLTHAYNGCELTAAWVTGGNAVEVNYKIAKSQLAEHNVYDSVNGKVNSKKAGDIKDTMTIDRDFIDGNGVRWSRIKNSGWVKVGTYTGTTTQTDAPEIDVTVTVTNNRLNRRVNATIFSATNGSYSKGDTLRIINTDYHDGYLWGQVAQSATDNTPVGWVALMYTNWSSVKDNGTTTDATNGPVIGTATVTVWGYLNLRNEPGTDGRIVGALARNDKVDLYEIKTVNGHQWGHAKAGWLCLTYTKVELNDNVTISDAGLKTYTFSGVVKNGAMKVHVEAGDNTNFVQYSVPHGTDPKKDNVKEDLSIPKDTAVTLSNFALVQGETWAKATWKNTEWKWKTDAAKDGKETVYNTRSGWVKLSFSSGIATFAATADPEIKIDPVKYTVAAESVNVRTGPSNNAATNFTLNKGVEVEVTDIVLGNENIWGYIEVKLTEQTGSEYKDGWINLASKYMSRNGVPADDDTSDTPETGLIGTVVGTDTLRVRSTGATYATRIGSLARGTVVRIWESDDGWYKVDSNGNGVYDYEEDGWVSGDYLDVTTGTIGGTSTVTDAAGNKFETDGTGKGIVANTYGGLNVRQGAGTAYASVGKLLPGSVVEILETSANGKWGRTAQGWVSMDYITMVSYNEVVNTPTDGTTVSSYDDAQKTTTTAVYTGRLNNDIDVYRNPEVSEGEKIRVANAGENVTVYELAAVTKNHISSESDSADNSTTTSTTTTTTTYWARINDGWIQTPETNLYLNALDEQVHTMTGTDTLKVRKGVDEYTANDAGDVFDVLTKGDQVNVTALDIIKDKVWGRIETNEGTGWVRLDYMSEGKVYLQQAPQNNTNNNSNNVVLGNGSSTGGFVDNSTGYRYTGNVIRANELNVRSTPSTAASTTTTLKNGQALVIYETTVAENMAWGRCDAGWVYLYYVDLKPVVNGAVDARVVYNDNTIIYTDVNCSAVAGTYSRMSTIDIYEVVGKMARTELGWVNTDDLL